MAQSAAPRHESTRRATYQDVLDAPAHVVAEHVTHGFNTPSAGALTDAGYGRTALRRGGGLGNPLVKPSM